jgi:hypothetical protein
MSGPLLKRSQNCSAQVNEYMSMSRVGSILCSHLRMTRPF